MRDRTVRPPENPIRCEITLPASKSISNRLLMMQLFSDNKIKISNLSEAGDTILMQELISKIIDTRQNADMDEASELDCGNAGTVLRFLASYLAGRRGNWILTGSERMKKRPVATLCNALRSLGASIEYLENEGFPPIAVRGKKLSGGRVLVDASESSQFVSSLMMLAPVLQNGLCIELSGEIASRPYLDMTLGLMTKAGMSASFIDNVIEIQSGSYQKSSFTVEPDWSAASYWYEIVALLPASGVLLRDLTLKSLQGDAILAEIYSNFGVGSYQTAEGVLLLHEAEPREKFNFDFTNYPDLVPAIAASCVALNIEAQLSGLKNLVIKESNRLLALKTELEKINPNISILDSGILKIGKSDFKQGNPLRFQTYNDHRMAMALAPLALCCGELTVENPEVVVKSYPDFWDHLLLAGFRFANF